MALVDSLLTAVVRSDGDALVLHVGEKPYVVAGAGPVELSHQGLGLGAMEGMLAQLLTADALRGLREMGAVEHELDDRPAAAGDRFTVVAARGGDDIWIELRRHRRVAPAIDAAPEHAAPVASAVAAPVTSVAPVAPAESMMAVAAPSPLAAHQELPDAPPADVEAPAPHVVARAADLTEASSPAEPAEPEMPAAAPSRGPLAPAALVVGEPLPGIEPVVTMAASDAHSAEVRPMADTPDATVSYADMAAAHLFAEELETPRDAFAGLDDDGIYDLALDELSVAELAAAVEPVVDRVAEPARDASGDFAPPPAAFASAAAAPEPVPAVSAPVIERAAVAVTVAEPVATVSAAPPAVTPAAATPVTIPAPAPALAHASAPAELPAAVATPAPEAAPEPVAVTFTPTAVAPSTPEFGRYDAPLSHAGWTPSAPGRFESEVSRHAMDAHPVLPGLASDIDTVDRDTAPPESLPAVVLSLTRDGARGSGGGSRGSVRPGGIERLLRLAAARGASALYLTTQARPAVRVDGDIRLLDGEPALSSGDVEAAVLELAPEGARDKESAEWIRDLADVGRVRITTFRDYRGPGALLRMIQARATSAEQLGLVREIQALATEPEGLVIVTGPRASGKSTLVSAFVDLINRQRNDYVITLEGQIRLVHESRGSLISQREVRGSAAEVVTAARAALRENPDVLVIEDLRSPDVLQAALDAAGSGLLVFVSVTGASATAALERLVDLCPSDQRRTVRAALAEHLRGVVAQVLLRKAGGGRLAARELVLNTNAVAALISDGQIAQLPRAIDSGRKLGMAPLNDALVAFVQSGAVDVREAYRKADDKVGLLALLRREGIDTSFVERLA